MHQLRLCVGLILVVSLCLTAEVSISLCPIQEATPARFPLLLNQSMPPVDMVELSILLAFVKPPLVSLSVFYM